MAKPDRARLDALIALATLLAPKARKLCARVTLAFDEPKAYVKKHASHLSERGIEEPIPSLPWFALIDGLADEKATFGIDWKTDAEDLKWAVRQIRGCPARAFAWMKRDEELEERSTWELLELSGKHLREQQVQLVSLDTDADEYNLALVPLELVTKIVRLATKAKYGRIDRFTGQQLTAATKDRIARAKKAKAEAARPVPKPKWDKYAKGKHTRAVKKAVTAYDIDCYGPGVKWFEMHYWPSAAAARDGLQVLLAQWAEDGFRKVTKREADEIEAGHGKPDPILPFSPTASYFSDRKLIRSVDLRDDCVVTTNGVTRESYGDVVSFHHERSPAAARARFNQVLAEYKAHGKPIARDKLLLKYGR
jgi:hypothetical protein